MLRRIGFVALLFALTTPAAELRAATQTYHLHQEASSTAGLFQLKTAGPDTADLQIQSANLYNQPAGDYLVNAFDTQAGIPNAGGIIPAGSTVTFTLWMSRQGSQGTAFPRAKLYLNSAAGTLLCSATGAAALTGSTTKYTLSCTTGSAITMPTTDRFYLWVGVSVTSPLGGSSAVAYLRIEGVLNGNYDSLVIAPLPNAPVITTLSPNSGAVGTTVTISGSNFGATQGSSTVRFNGVAATPTSWGASSITAPVPSGATTGPVVVTVGGMTSNGVSFTVLGKATGMVSRRTDGAPLNGARVEALQSGNVIGSATTNAAGSYQIALGQGSYSVRALLAEYSSQTQDNVSITSGQTTTVNLQLVPIISYQYDELDRLVSVIDPATDSATYSYDAVGNLLAIGRSPVSTVKIIEFTPNSGMTGSPVTIFGTGFSPTPAQNTVKFNGVIATVASVSATQIVTTVPAGAASGPIAVTAPGGAASSAAAFSVTGSNGAPTISSVSPTIVAAGSSVTIGGTNFDVTLGGNAVSFNIARAPVTAATTTALTVTVPSNATSGKVAVRTALGAATSTSDVFIPPAPSFTPADVDTTGRMSIGTSLTKTIASAGKIAMVVFDGTQGHKVSLKLSNVTIGTDVNCTAQVFIYNPDGSLLVVQCVGTNGGFIEPRLLPASATYTIIVDANPGNTGSITLSLYDVPPDPTGTVTVGGASAPIATTVPGQNATVTFSGSLNQTVTVHLTSNTMGLATVSLLKPDGSVLTTTQSSAAAFNLASQALPVAGTYSIFIDPFQANIGSITVQVSSP